MNEMNAIDRLAERWFAKEEQLSPLELAAFAWNNNDAAAELERLNAIIQAARDVEQAAYTFLGINDDQTSVETHEYQTLLNALAALAALEQK